MATRLLGYVKRCHVDVRFWPLADIQLAPTNVGFGGKADITVGGQNVRLWHKADIGLCAAHVCF